MPIGHPAQAGLWMDAMPRQFAQPASGRGARDALRDAHMMLDCC